MKAIVYTEYGPPEVLQLKERKQPVPKSNELLIRIHASPVNYGDLIARNFSNLPPDKFNMPLLFRLMARFLFGFTKPRKGIPGSEFSGIIEAVGGDVHHFKQGDPVFGYVGQQMGAYAEYLCMPETGVVALKPATMSYEEAAAVPYGSIMAYHFLRYVTIQPGQRVLINGASGGIGSAAVQLAKHFGARVTGVCSTSRLSTVKSLGADTVIDYTKVDFTNNGETYDLIIDILGKCPFSRARHSLKPNGIHLLVSFKMKHIVQMLWIKLLNSLPGQMQSRKLLCALAPERQEYLIAIKELIEAGKLKSIIDRCYPMEQAADAHRYVEEGNRKGSVVISMTPTLSDKPEIER